MNTTRVLLVRPLYPGFTGPLGLLQTEPLELEYLAQAVNELGGSYQILDGAKA